MIHRPNLNLNGIQKQKVKMVNQNLMDSLEILAKQNLVSEKFYADQMKKMKNGGLLAYADDSPPMENKFYHQAKSEAEQRMAMRAAAGAMGVSPPPKPAPPPGFQKNEPTDAPVDVEVHREN